MHLQPQPPATRMLWVSWFSWPLPHPSQKTESPLLVSPSHTGPVSYLLAWAPCWTRSISINVIASWEMWLFCPGISPNSCSCFHHPRPYLSCLFRVSMHIPNGFKRLKKLSSKDRPINAPVEDEKQYCFVIWAKPIRTVLQVCYQNSSKGLKLESI